MAIHILWFITEVCSLVEYFMSAVNIKQHVSITGVLGTSILIFYVFVLCCFIGHMGLCTNIFFQPSCLLHYVTLSLNHTKTEILVLWLLFSVLISIHGTWSHHQSKGWRSWTSSRHLEFGLRSHWDGDRKGEKWQKIFLSNSISCKICIK